MINENKINKHYKDELLTLGQLRNFLEHEQTKDVLAIVTNETLSRFKTIESNLSNPKKIYEVFSKGVECVSITDSLEKVLKIVKEKEYSQFPVLENNIFQGFISDNGITNWLAGNIEEEIFSIKETSVKDIIAEEEEQKNFKILVSGDNLYDVIGSFDKGLKNHSSFVVIVINSPKHEILLDDLYTIITPWDLNKVYKEVGLTIEATI